MIPAEGSKEKKSRLGELGKKADELANETVKSVRRYVVTAPMRKQRNEREKAAKKEAKAAKKAAAERGRTTMKRAMQVESESRIGGISRAQAKQDIENRIRAEEQSKIEQAMSAGRIAAKRTTSKGMEAYERSLGGRSRSEQMDAANAKFAAKQAVKKEKEDN